MGASMTGARSFRVNVPGHLHSSADWRVCITFLQGWHQTAVLFFVSRPKAAADFINVCVGPCCLLWGSQPMCSVCIFVITPALPWWQVWPAEASSSRAQTATAGVTAVAPVCFWCWVWAAVDQRLPPCCRLHWLWQKSDWRAEDAQETPGEQKGNCGLC